MEEIGRNCDAIYENSNEAELPAKLLAERQIHRFRNAVVIRFTKIVTFIF